MEVLEKFRFGQNSDSGTNASYLGDENSNSTLGFQKFEIKVQKRPYIYL